MKPEKDFNTALREVKNAFEAIRAEGRETIKIIQEGNRFYPMIDSMPQLDLLAPLRAAGVISKNPCDKATPERVVEMAVQRIADLQRQVARLRKGMQQRDEAQHGKGVRRKLGEAVDLLSQIRDSIERVPSPASAAGET